MINFLIIIQGSKMKKIGIRILGCMALLSMVGCGRIEGASVQDLSNTKDAIVESETTLAENNNEYSNKNSLFYSDISFSPASITSTTSDNPLIILFRAGKF